MPTPETAAIGATGRVLAALLKPAQPLGHAPVGSRLERRHAYLRHAQAAAQYVLASGWQEEAVRHGTIVAMLTTRPVIHESLAASAAMLASLTELRMVATPEVLGRAETLAESARTAQQDIDAYRRASAEFLTLVRAELGYAVRWWQLHRRLGAWWRARPDRRAARALQREARAEIT
ncbi:hypothetical protein OG618_37500 (plasmid) [Kitasatospora sp. NBC_01246]|uniref:hypothetical protein n=1 Tax=Kitasatospora sp. NBC_01246 TaxID=2903570 RepID=UPI002E33E6B1|nr:hypothetical protein [Kitasatospora sp. NBC_01246]